jgi:hypothetical protein
MGGPPEVRLLVERERLSLSEHRAAMRGRSAFGPPKSAPRGTFLHGFLLPFSLMMALLRHPTLGRPYVRLTLVRTLVVGLFAALAFLGSDRDPSVAESKRSSGPVIHFNKKIGPPAPASSANGVHVHAPGIHIDLDGTKDEKKVVVLGQNVPVVDDSEPKDAAKEQEDTHPILKLLSSSWSWILWVIGVVSAAEAVVVFFSRRYDDWLGFHASSLAHIKPEDETPKTPKLAFDFKWLVKKVKRKARGYVVFAAGVPLLALFQLVPSVGGVLFSIALTAWGWYWLGVFTAAKTDHAWVDEETAPSPTLIRELHVRSAGHAWLKPVNLYLRFWAWLTREMNSCASAFERNPTPFLGLALARAVLALPFLYLLFRPIIPIAAGRLCAESDPSDRFSATFDVLVRAA